MKVVIEIQRKRRAGLATVEAFYDEAKHITLAGMALAGAKEGVTLTHTEVLQNTRLEEYDLETGIEFILVVLVDNKVDLRRLYRVGDKHTPLYNGKIRLQGYTYLLKGRLVFVQDMLLNETQRQEQEVSRMLDDSSF